MIPLIPGAEGNAAVVTGLGRLDLRPRDEFPTLR